MQAMLRGRALLSPLPVHTARLHAAHSRTWRLRRGTRLVDASPEPECELVDDPVEGRVTTGSCRGDERFGEIMMHGERPMTALPFGEFGIIRGALFGPVAMAKPPLAFPVFNGLDPNGDGKTNSSSELKSSSHLPFPGCIPAAVALMLAPAPVLVEGALLTAGEFARLLQPDALASSGLFCALGGVVVVVDAADTFLNGEDCGKLLHIEDLGKLLHIEDVGVVTARAGLVDCREGAGW